MTSTATRLQQPDAFDSLTALLPGIAARAEP